MDYETVILLSSTGDLRRSLKSAPSHNILVICMDESAREMARSLDVPFRSTEDYLDLTEAELREKAHGFSLSWYIADGIDYSKFDDCSLAEFFYSEINYRLFYETEKKIVLLSGIQKLLSPKFWILATDQNALYKNIILAITNDPPIIHTHLPSPIKWFKHYGNLRELRIWLRDEGLDYLARAAYFKLTSWRSKAVMLEYAEQVDAVFVSEQIVTSAMNTLIPVILKIPDRQRLVIAADPRCLPVLEENGIHGTPFQAAKLGLRQPSLPPDFKKWLSTQWQTLSKKREAREMWLSFNGINIWPLCKSTLRKYFFRRIPYALEHYQLAYEILDRYNIPVVVVATDIHYNSLLFIRAAQKQGKKSLTIQHGMVNHPEGYLPVRATQLAVMGDAVRDWCIEYGASPEQVVATGQPRFDALAQDPRLSRQQLLTDLGLSPEPEKITWLLAPEPQLGLWMRDLLFTALENLPEIQAFIRVHPNDNPLDYSLGLQHHPQLESRVRISRQHDVASSLHACDVVVMGRSTLGLEALLVGKPLIIVIPPSKRGWILPPYLQEYIETADFLRASNPDELITAWRRLEDPSSRETRRELQDELVKRYAFSADGKSAERVLKVIKRFGDEIRETPPINHSS